MSTSQSILHFWFDELTPKQHFLKDAALDETIRARFGNTLEAAARCELFAWRKSWWQVRKTAACEGVPNFV